MEIPKMIRTARELYQGIYQKQGLRRDPADGAKLLGRINIALRDCKDLHVAAWRRAATEDMSIILWFVDGMSDKHGARATVANILDILETPPNGNPFC